MKNSGYHDTAVTQSRRFIPAAAPRALSRPAGRLGSHLKSRGVGGTTRPLVYIKVGKLAPRVL